MTEILLNNEKDLIKKIKENQIYKHFQARDFQYKVEREKRAWQLLQEYRGRYTQDILNQIFDTVDIYEGSKHWFGALLATPNRNLIFQTEPDILSKWLDELLFSNKGVESALNICLKDIKSKRGQ